MAEVQAAVQGATSAAAEVMLRNQGAADVAFSICAAPGTALVGLPPWLDVIPCSGVLPAQVQTLLVQGLELTHFTEPGRAYKRSWSVTALSGTSSLWHGEKGVPAG